MPLIAPVIVQQEEAVMAGIRVAIIRGLGVLSDTVKYMMVIV